MKTDFYKYGFFALIVVVILVYVFKGQGSDGREIIKKYEQEVKVLQDEIDVLQDKNDSIRGRMANYNDSLRVLRSETTRIEKRRKAAIRYYEKRIKAIDDLHVHELDSLFASRYGFGSSPPESDSN
jgi:predicted nuclease with TOPRIM domain